MSPESGCHEIQIQLRHDSPAVERMAPELKQVLERADQGTIGCLQGRGGGEIGPVRRDQRLGPVRQNQNEMQVLLPFGVPEYFQRPSLKRMVPSSDRYTLRVVPKMGSLRWVPLTPFHTPN